MCETPCNGTCRTKTVRIGARIGQPPEPREELLSYPAWREGREKLKAQLTAIEGALSDLSARVDPLERFGSSIEADNAAIWESIARLEKRLEAVEGAREAVRELLERFLERSAV